jgi:hypothetical protein
MIETLEELVNDLWQRKMKFFENTQFVGRLENMWVFRQIVIGLNYQWVTV